MQVRSDAKTGSLHVRVVHGGLYEECIFFVPPHTPPQAINAASLWARRTKDRMKAQEAIVNAVINALDQ